MTSQSHKHVVFLLLRYAVLVILTDMELGERGVIPKQRL